MIAVGGNGVGTNIVLNAKMCNQPCQYIFQMCIHFHFIVIAQKTNEQMAGGIIFGICFSYGKRISAFIYSSIRRYQVVIGDIGPVSVGSHTPCLNGLQPLSGIIGDFQYSSAFMMHSNTYRGMLFKWPWICSIPFFSWYNLHNVGKSCGFFAVITRTVNRRYRNGIARTIFGSHTPCLNGLQPVSGIIGDSQYSSAFMMHSNTYRGMLFKWPWICSIPFFSWYNLHTVGKSCGFFAFITRTVNRRYRNG